MEVALKLMPRLEDIFVTLDAPPQRCIWLDRMELVCLGPFAASHPLCLMFWFLNLDHRIVEA